MVDVEPIFTAVSSNAHHLYTLLQCIGFAPKASVQLTPDGIRFSVEETRTVQGLAFLDKALFTSYTFNPPPPPPPPPPRAAAPTPDEHNHDDTDSPTTDPTPYYPCFEISLTALLETLKIIGINDSSTTSGGSGSSRAGSVQPGPSHSAFTTPALLLDRSCTLRYDTEGSPLSITLTETGIKTICELTTYEPEGGEVEIPLQRDAIIMKIIMRSAWLHNAITELAATNPATLRISASATQEPFFALSGAGGSFSESSVEFSVENQTPTIASGAAANDGHDEGASRAKRARLAPTVTETFLVSPLSSSSSGGSRIRQDYRFKAVQKASRAMAVANKVSIRGDRQGVLSLQFMIESDVHAGNISGAKLSARGGLAPVVSFVDFRFVPLLDDEEVL
ncbi:hypothetical protein BO82DRAFT_18768 [Aspergillus uvarum CBS 121591]|uniref:Rad1-domain-containing protein n=1 Tax=Aspergillus uvarum CBS 121591 TaxID=1448315 RepID=A0A319CKQ8_9EURO|nr:hypothetical protein BO82DRAFT_18768 [Aspergillus uvarum CBS 121591]PYH84491.1 hypothetical protein BO82DRAFT_18768 [Aspergillus uvarum CBS 121591]